MAYSNPAVIGAQIIIAYTPQSDGSPPLRGEYIVVEPDPEKAKAIARRHLGPDEKMDEPMPLPLDDMPKGLAVGFFGPWMRS